MTMNSEAGDENYQPKQTFARKPCLVATEIRVGRDVPVPRREKNQARRRARQLTSAPPPCEWKRMPLSRELSDARAK